MEPIGAVYRFYLNEWHKVMVPTGLSPLEAYTVPGFEGLQELPSANTPFGEMNDLLETTFMRGLIFNKTTFTTDEAYQLEELFIRDVYVYAEAMSAEAVKAGDTAFVSAMKSLRDDSVGFLLANDIRDAPSDTDATQHIQQFMINYFDAVTQWTTVMKITTSEIKIEYAMFNISCNLNFTSVTVTVPQDRGQLYRILDEVNGELVEQDTAWSGSGGGFLSPESVPPEPAASRIVDTSQNLGLSHLVFGFGRRIEGDSLEELYLPGDKSIKLRKAVLRKPRDSHVMTMGRLGVRIKDLSAKFGAQCNYTHTAEIPAFSLVNNSAQPTRLVSRYTYGQRVEYEILHEYNFPVFNYSYQMDENCSAAIDNYHVDSSYNYIYQEHPLQLTYTAALFQLFQNARLLDPLPADKCDSLAFQGNQELFDVAITLPVALFALACFGCLITMILIVRTFQTRDRIDPRLLRQPTAVLQAHLNGTDFPRQLLSLGVQTRPGESELPLDTLQHQTSFSV
ncbi:hypothetical protein PHYSODRAFT_306760 [Phytophthora sojae]|uniref:Uncharacterized protein n=1 Tax=Phytophthora sojae (strain P6497) TaxID=1094619 RepID=G5AAR2_PHYSP|nr:hypothetical protein PHYSODRAFT_306760 [Phytophthora sojae]EGZ07691.1 hypothetical protein PHYSODRAFT_306760 [Phytophthora sojae]|eukprot:XP_009537257.1 hypothetical protein PHYSODRAFT_306760 [Phytophthora sojae]